MEGNADVHWENPLSRLRIRRGKIPRYIKPQAKINTHTQYHKVEPVETTDSKIRSTKMSDVETHQ